jgi:hypothetical protein
MAAKWTPTVEDDFPSPTIETRWLATSSAESVGFPSSSQKREEHLESVAAGAARLVRGHTVQYAFDQPPDAVLPQIARLRHRD